MALKQHLGYVELFSSGGGNGGGSGGGGVDLSSAFLGSTSGLEAYRSGIDFSVTRNDATSLNLAGLSFEPLARLFVLIEDFDSSGAFIASYTPNTNVFDWDSANQRITVTGSAFSAGGAWNVSIWGPPRTVALPENAQMVIEQNQARYGSDDSGISMIAAPQLFTDAWADLGGEISMFGLQACVFYLKLRINSDFDLRFRVLAKHTSGGTEEYMLPIKTPSLGVVAVEGQYFEFTNDVDQQIIIPVETLGAIPYLQPQIQRGVDGAGTDSQVDSSFYIRGV